MISVINDIKDILQSIIEFIPKVIEYLHNIIHQGAEYLKMLFAAQQTSYHVMTFLFPAGIVAFIVLLWAIVIFLRIVGKD